MAKKLTTQYPPSFFQVMNYPNFQSLRVPIAFRRKYRAIMSMKKAKLRISSAGEIWEVKVEMMEDGYYQFTEGWAKFAEDLELEKSDFLVFSYMGRSTFEVSAYGFDGVGKESFDYSYVLIEDSSDDDEDDESHGKNKQSRTSDDEDMTNTNPKFEIVLKPHQQSRVTIRKNFAEAAGLIGKKKVAMEYVGGSRSNVVLDLRTKMNNWFRLDLSNGWAGFRTKNRLSYGKTYSFEFIPSKQFIQVKNIIRS